MLAPFFRSSFFREGPIPGLIYGSESAAGASVKIAAREQAPAATKPSRLSLVPGPRR